MCGPEIKPAGPALRASVVLAELSAAVFSKARAAARRSLVTPDPDYPDSVWWVSSLRPQQQINDPYRVSSDLDPVTWELSWINCTCPHGAKTGGGYSRCYHAGAVLLSLTEER